MLYCMGIKHGGKKEWEFAYERMKVENVASEADSLRYAMSCSKETWILSRYLSYTLDPNEIRKQDAVSAMIYISRNSVGRSLAWDHIRSQWTTIRDVFGASAFSFSNLVKGVTESFNTQFQLKELEAFMEDNPDQGTAARAFKQAVEKTKSNIKWMEINYDNIAGWLKNKTIPVPEATKVDVRLPLKVYPEHYNVELKPDMYGDDLEQFYFTGHVDIIVKCVNTTSVITLHSNKLNISNMAFWGVDDPSAPALKDFSEDKERQFLLVQLADSLKKDHKYQLSINFTGPLKNDLTGLYLSSYNNGSQTVHIATTQFQPTDARKAFPCFDEPAIKATFNTTLWRKKHMSSISNMPIMWTEAKGDDWFADHYMTTVKMSTYLLAFIVSDFSYKEKNTTTGTTLRVWARPSAVNQVEYALDTGVSVLEYFEDYFNISFPLPKQDMVAVPDFAAGAMENWGLIIYRETALLYDPKVSSATNKQRVAVVVSHELAHQWFGNLVTPSWWDDLWLNEGFASYVEYLGVDHVHEDWKMMNQIVVEDVQDVFRVDALGSSHPIYVPVGHPDEINEIFDRISYGKGASIIRMMKFYLGEETFKRGLTNYLNSRAYDAAFHDDLWAALSEQARLDDNNIDVKSVMDTWILQMGFPVVTVTRDGNSLQLHQQHFLIDPSQTPDPKYPSDFKYIWKIPFSYVSNIHPAWDGRLHLMMGREDSINVTEPLDWIIANVEQQGYFRVNYDHNNWNRLKTQLTEDHEVIHENNRAQIIDDAFNLGRAEHLEQTVGLEMTEYLHKEKDYVPWEAASVNLAYIGRMLGHSEGYGDYQKYLQSLVLPLYDYVGWEKTDDSHLLKYLRSIVLSYACSTGHQPCIDGAVKRYSDWMDDPTANSIDPDLKSLVYCTAIKHGGVKEWEFAYERMKTENVASEADKLRYAMSCTQQSWILSRYLSYTLNPDEIRKQDAVTTVVYIARNSNGRPLAWDFLRANWDYILNEYGSGFFSFTRLISGITESFNTDFQLTQLEDFVKDNPEQGTATRAFQQAIETTKGNIRWMKRNQAQVTEWLRNKTTTGPEVKRLDVRLPLKVYPEHYNVELKPDMYGSDPEQFYFSGKVDIIVKCVNTTSVITLHSNKLNITDIAFRGMNAESSPTIKEFSEDKERQFLLVHLTSYLTEGMKYKLSINFTGPLKNDLAGLYLSTYKNGTQDVHIATTQFQPTDARKAFPCFDEPAVKATFNTTLLRKTHMTSISNMPIMWQEEREDGWVADHYMTTVKMSTYLLAFIVSDFAYKQKNTSGGTMVRVWARPSAVDQVDYALDTGVQILEYYEEYFNISFPLPKQDMVAVPDFAAGAMENWGLIIYRETALLYDPKVSSATNQQRVAVVVSHELAHQWFGNLVTPSWWDDLWLNEGFASYVEYLGVNFTHPDWKMMRQIVVEDVQDVFKVDALGSSHPIYVPVNHPDEINEIFDRISYGKGASIIRMMKYYLGEDTFRKGLTNYLNNKAYDAAFHDDLWDALSQQAASENRSIDVKSVMDTWILQMGFPVVTVTRDGNSLQLDQQHFLIDPSQTPDPKYPSPYSYTWKIPFTFTTNTETNLAYSSFLITKESSTIQVNNSFDWVIANAEQQGYFRVNYDENNWKQLRSQIMENHKVIDESNRAQIIDDAFNLGRAEHLEQTVALEMTEYLHKEQEYVPWEAASVNFAYLGRMLGQSAAYGDYQKYLQSLVLPLYDIVGWGKQDDSHLTKYLRSLILSYACSTGHQPCIDGAVKRYSDWMKDPDANPVDPDLKSLVYCTAIKNAGINEWEFAYERMKKENVASEADKLRYAMSCTQESWILSRYLMYTVNPDEIRKQDAVTSMVYIARNPIGRPLAWDFLRANWDFIFNQYGSGFFSFTRLISGITESFNSDFQLAQLKEFVEDNPQQGTATRAFQQAIETTKSNIRWMKRNEEVVSQWLKNKTSTDTTAPTKPQDVRLPLFVYPDHYDLTIQPFIYDGDPEGFNFTGHVDISVTCRNTTDVITIHINKLTIDKITLSGITNPTAPEYREFKEDPSRHFLLIYFNGPLLADNKYLLSIYFHGPLKNDLTGLYLSSYNNGTDPVYLATTMFAPVDARKAFPCFDEPAVKATFNITLVRKEHLRSIANMPLLEKEALENGWVADHFQKSVKMSTYLLAFMISDFIYKENTTTLGTKIRVWSRPDAIEQVNYALEIGVRILEYFEEYFNISFPLPKQDMVAIPDFSAGAMENWGLIMYRETALLYDPDVSSAVNQQRVAVVVSHELSHQWFGNLVTPSWWDDIWLNEGFASYVEYLGVNEVHPDWKMMNQIIVEDVQRVFAVDALGSSHPIYVPVGHPDEINEIFDSISYQKGASIIRMMKYYLGEKTFQRGLTNYLRERSYAVAFHDDLWEALSAQATLDGNNIDVKSVMDTWILQMGFPVVTVTRDGNSLQLHQQHFLTDPSQTPDPKYPSPYSYKWQIPFTVTASDQIGEGQNVTLIKEVTERVNFSSTGTWILANIEQQGYFRVNYDTANWDALKQQLMNNHTVLHEINRAQLIDDAFNLGRAEILNQTVGLEMTEYLGNEQEYVPWRAASTNFDYLDRMLSQSAVYGKYQQYLQNLILPLYNYTGWEKTDDTHLMKYLRGIVLGLACRTGYKPCVQEAVKRYANWMADPMTNSVDPNLKSLVYCTGIREGGTKEWDFAYERMKVENVAAEADRLRNAMACSNIPWILNRYLTYTLNPDLIRKADATTAIVYISRNVLGKSLAWDFVRDNWDYIQAEYGSGIFAFARLISGITESFNTVYQLQQLEQFMEDNPDQGTGARAFQQAVETTKSNIRWMQRNVDTLSAWLDTKVTDTS